MNTNITNVIVEQATNAIDTFKPATQRQALWHMLTKPLFDYFESIGLSKVWVMLIFALIVSVLINIIVPRIGGKSNKKDISLIIFPGIIILIFLAMAIYDQIRRFSK